MDKHDELNVQSEAVQEGLYSKRYINLPNIKHISARRTGDILAVFNTMKRCEELDLMPDQQRMICDIVESVNEHARSVSGYYLVRYGMLLEREEQMRAEADHG